MISHFELYFDLVLVIPEAAYCPHAVARITHLQVGSFLHLGGLMNLDFGNILKDTEVKAGAAASTSETLPGIFGTVPNFTAAVIFFVALWNSWCVLTRDCIPCLRRSLVP